MGREQRIEGATSRATSQVQPTFYLVGAPGTGKARLAEALAERFESKLAYQTNALDGTRYALGSVADYRIELKLALSRTLREDGDMPILYTHSLIDNLAYISFALSRYQLGSVRLGTAERAILTMTLIGTMLADSFVYDHIFFLHGNFDPSEDYEQSSLQALLQMTLDEYQLNYSIIPANENAEDNIAAILEEYLSE